MLDLGAAPGGFLQVLAETVGERGVAVGVDIEPIRNLGKSWVKTALVDLLAPDALAADPGLHASPFHLVTSDMAPKTIGVKVSDEARSLELCRMALSVARQTLKRGGSFVTKVFMGGDFPDLQEGGRAALRHRTSWLVRRRRASTASRSISWARASANPEAVLAALLAVVRRDGSG